MRDLTQDEFAVLHQLNGARIMFENLPYINQAHPEQFFQAIDQAKTILMARPALEEIQPPRQAPQ